MKMKREWISGFPPSPHVARFVCPRRRAAALHCLLPAAPALAPALTDAATAAAAAALPSPCWQPELLADGKLLDIALGIKVTNSMLATLAEEDEANS